jgi:glycosyltransferase involved in cell wall biosynthesis
MRLLIVSTKERLAGYSEFSEALDSLGVEAICVHSLKYCSLSESKPLHIVPFPKLLKLVKRFNPDFVMTDDLPNTIDMAKLVNQRVLLHLRGAWNEFYWDRAMYPSLFVRIYINYIAIRCTSLLRKIDLILPNSKWLQKQVKQQFPDHPTQVLYVGINAGKWVPSQNTPFEVKHPAVVGVFPLAIYQKISGLLKFTRVIRKMPDVNFYFAGDGPYFNLVKQNCPANMFLIGRVTEMGVKKLLESGDIFVHPSGLDALPRGVKEASLMEKPIVASNVGGIPEIVKNNQTGYLCEIDDVEQWIGKIRFLLDNPDVARRFGKNARKYVENTFDWRKIAERLLAILRDFNERV